MRHLWPRSLLGQMLLAVALALLVAQSVSAVLLYRAADARRDAAAINAAAFRLVGDARNSDERLMRGERRGRQRGARRDRSGRLPQALRIEASRQPSIMANETREAELEQELTTILAREGLDVAEAVVTHRRALDDPSVLARRRLVRRIENSGERDLELVVASIRLQDSAEWRVIRGVKMPNRDGGPATIIAQTLLLYVLLVALHYLLLRRITRPLAKLTDRTEAFDGGLVAARPLKPEGPADIRRLMIAHNGMEARIAALLDEKDVMLGAIGHDLKTPLAALRVRIESVDDAQERGKMAQTIADISRSLDDILSLARVGRASEPPERTELSALVASVVEEFEDMGRPVTLADTRRIALPIHASWLKRGLRNLIDNALRYAGTAAVSLHEQNGAITLRVDDEGPGIPADRLPTIAEPFTRGETSRNRATGGAGLGLTLARAIAEQHGGSLHLENRPQGGLRAEIRLPRGR